MKKIIFAFAFCLTSIISMAQQKPVTLSFKDPVEDPNTVLVSGKFILVSIDGWGKARFDCESWGLCRAQFIYCTHNNVPVSCLRTTKSSKYSRTRW